MEVRRWNSNVYPNLSFMSQFQQLRVIHPLAVDRTLVCTYNFRLKGAPEQMFHNTIRFANIVNGTGSLVLTDDLEIYNRIGSGFPAKAPNGCRSVAAFKATCRMSTAAAAARTRPAKSISATCSMPGSTIWAAPAPEPSTGSWRACRHERAARSACGSRACRDRGGKRLDVREEASSFCSTRPGCSTKPGSTNGWRCLRRKRPTGSRASRAGQSARNRLADLRRPAASGNARAPAGEPAHLLAGAAVANEPHRHQRDAQEDAEATTLVRSKFVLIEFRRNEQRLFGGTSFIG